MHISIRYKLFIYMIITVILFAVLLFSFNTFFAEKYYIQNKKNVLIKCSEELIKLIADKTTKVDFTEEVLSHNINFLEKSIGGTITICNYEGEIYYPSWNKPKPEHMPGLMHFDKMPPPQNIPDKWEKYNKNSYFTITKDPSYEIETLRFQIQQDNGIILMVWVPMAQIADNAEVSNSFTIIVGFITILITSIWTILVSDKFTKPIKEMNKLTKQMSKLNFTETLKIESKDELGELSESINHLSENLDIAINELHEKNEKLELDICHERQLDSMRKEFVSNVSHELKTPIFLIQGYAEGLKANIAQSQEKKEFYCDVIMEETEKMDTLVKELLDLSRVENGLFTIHRTNFNISDLAYSILSKYEKTFEEKEFHITTELEDNLIINADNVRVEQVMVNYINNAINYGDEKKLIKLTLNKVQNHARLTVYNSGVSIPENSIDKIWTSFYKVDKARTRGLGGTGLGLSIVRAIQEAHGNSYGVCNVMGGIEFWCEYPLADTII